MVRTLNKLSDLEQFIKMHEETLLSCKADRIDEMFFPFYL